MYGHFFGVFNVQPLALANLARRLPKSPTSEVDISNRKPIIIGRRDMNRNNMFTRTPAPLKAIPSEPEEERNVAIKELADEVYDKMFVQDLVDEHAKHMAELQEMEQEHARDMAEREQLRQQGIYKEYTMDVNHTPEILEQEAQKDRESLERCNMGEEDKRSSRVEIYRKEQEDIAAREAARNVVDPKEITKWLTRVPIADKSMLFEVNTVPSRIKHLFNKDKVERNGSTYRLEVYINGVECESTIKGYVGAINASCGGRGVKSVELTWRAI